MEKEKFQMPEMEVIVLEPVDIVMTSKNETQVVPMTGSGSNP